MSEYPGDQHFADMQTQINKARIQFDKEVDLALVAARQFASEVINSIPEVTIAEAKLAIVAYFAEKIR